MVPTQSKLLDRGLLDLVIAHHDERDELLMLTTGKDLGRVAVITRRGASAWGVRTIEGYMSAEEALALHFPGARRLELGEPFEIELLASAPPHLLARALMPSQRQHLYDILAERYFRFMQLRGNVEAAAKAGDRFLILLR
ncbi:hypothetical protein ABUL39_13025 [Rhodothermus marinus]|uniref:hypothetical protein n=1 Tax=Rhodothermus marinus TaxID=29549 RepID=UPI0037C50039